MTSSTRVTGPETTAIVTGAASGIGRAIATALVERGGDVVLTDIDVDLAREVASELNIQIGRPAASAVFLDVTDASAFNDLVEGVVGERGRLDCLVNNAGIAAAGEAQELTAEHWDRVLDVNLHGTVHGVRAAYPTMVAQGHGHIVNIASVGGLLPMPLFIPYNTSKFGVTGLTLGLRAEAATHRVGITLVCPGVIETSLLDTTGPSGTAPPPTAPDVRSFITTYMGRPRSVTDLAERVIRGIERNRPIVIFPRRARLASVIMRISPRLVLAVTRGSVRQEQARRHTQKNPRKPTPPLPLLTRPWTPGPAAWTSEAVVNATRTEIHRWRDLPGIVLGGQNLRRRWGSQPGAIEMRAALQPLRRVAWTVSVWETERDLSNFIRSPHHVAILTPYKERVTVRGITWAARSTDRERLWSEAQQRLEPPLTESKLHPSAPREESA